MKRRPTLSGENCRCRLVELTLVAGLPGGDGDEGIGICLAPAGKVEQ